MREYEIAMLGPRGVGKTSLLTVMFDRFAAATGGADLQLVPVGATRAKLADRLLQLKELAQKDDTLDVGAGVEGNADKDEFVFDLGRRGRKPDLRLKFHDYPGGFLLDANAGDVEALVQRCSCVLVPINAAALMVERGRYHARLNRPDVVLQILQAKLTDEALAQYGPRLVVLAPVKCESWMGKRADQEKLLAEVRAGYAGLLDHLACDALRPGLAVVIAPVQTVGSAVFTRVEVRENVPTFHYTRKGFDAGYEPQDSEQILRYALRFLLKMHLSGRSFPWLRDLFGLDKDFKEAAKAFAEGCRTETPFQILQGHALL